VSIQIHALLTCIYFTLYTCSPNHTDTLYTCSPNHTDTLYTCSPNYKSFTQAYESEGRVSLNGRIFGRSSSKFCPTGDLTCFFQVSSTLLSTFPLIYSCSHFFPLALIN
jgi:hypothetical protein